MFEFGRVEFPPVVPEEKRMLDMFSISSATALNSSGLHSL